MVNPSTTTRMMTRARKSLKPNLKLKVLGLKFRVYRLENNSYGVDVLEFEVLKLAALTVTLVEWLSAITWPLS